MGASDFAKGCDIERCYKHVKNNFIDFRCLDDGRGEYHFMIVWDNGVHTLEWIQKEHPLSIRDTAANLVRVKLDGIDVTGQPNNRFRGLSISSQSGSTLLDGNPGSSWWYSIGNIVLHSGGNPGPLPQAYIAQKTELFIKMKYKGEAEMNFYSL